MPRQQQEKKGLFPLINTQGCCLLLSPLFPWQATLKEPPAWFAHGKPGGRRAPQSPSCCHPRRRVLLLLRTSGSAPVESDGEEQPEALLAPAVRVAGAVQLCGGGGLIHRDRYRGLSRTLPLLSAWGLEFKTCRLFPPEVSWTLRVL